MKIIKVKNEAELGKVVGDIFIKKVKENPKLVIGLATGSSPISTYKYISKDFRDNKTDWSQSTSFNLDEYKGLAPTHSHSYRYFMNDNFFNHINIRQGNTFVPSGLETDHPENYDQLIAERGGIDIQLLGIGVNGHIGFNEPGSSFDGLTSVVDLTESTIKANSRFFASPSEVPTQAVSMGLKSIMNAKEIVLIATGTNKAEAIFHLVKGPVSEQWPCSILQNHPNVTVVVDENAGSKI